MKKYLYPFVILILLNTQIIASFEEKFIGVRPYSMGGAFVAVADDLNATHFNPAGLVQLPGLGFNFSYCNFYSMSELNSLSIEAALPTKKKIGTFGLSYMRFWNSGIYSENTITATHSFYILNKILVGYNLKLLGMSINYNNSSGIDYGSAFRFTFDIGIMIAPIRDFIIGFSVKNIIAPKFGNENTDSISRKVSAGIAYHILNGLLLSISIDKASMSKFQFRSGCEIWFKNIVSIRLGIITNPFNMSYGLGFKFKYFTMDYGIIQNNIIGLSHIVSCAFIMDKKNGKKDIFKPKEERPANIHYFGEKININEASAIELETLPRIGEKTAALIIEYREKNGPFKTIYELINVPRIGEKTFEKYLENRITVGEEDSSSETGFDINKCEMKDLVDLGISIITSAKIIQYRIENGKFDSIEELRNVDGITDNDILIIKNNIGKK